MFSFGTNSPLRQSVYLRMHGHLAIQINGRSSGWLRSNGRCFEVEASKSRAPAKIHFAFRNQNNESESMVSSPLLHPTNVRIKKFQPFPI